MHVRIEEMLETVFAVQSMLKLYSEHESGTLFSWELTRSNGCGLSLTPPQETT
jgi:predicted secreted protein